ncbi:hypothetical protein ZIOFF_071167 [Zingiber officinale]|uniref:Uncharacterized protein n=1 Tax=Zingiber officinale TaxID=94328 RepID=A0A8J5C3E5_ZINOF|nr:hypothetical protein ZIOFF_071167 [Zingiber officinale]
MQAQVVSDDEKEYTHCTYDSGIVTGLSVDAFLLLAVGESVIVGEIMNFIAYIFALVVFVTPLGALIIIVRFALLLELVLGDKTLTEFESQHYEFINTYIEKILVIPVRPCHVDFRNNLTCHRQDILKVNGGIQKLQLNSSGMDDYRSSNYMLCDTTSEP